ncbi:MAG: polyribonucleotide nucleotidyltransferase [Candidatus Omnitrophica bacterium CG1_02_49_10]|nr:MAG: polyribonucleotide nucleotidyltransferase [Candidatus Omnitrophica bacterium CG1_02_49_10]
MFKEMKSYNIDFGGRELVMQSGKMARQADGAVIIQYEGTIILVTAVIAKKPKEGLDFFPLTIEYQEKTYAAGRIPGGFFKREGRPTEREILTSRLIDRPIRPLFLDDFKNEVQVMAMVLSSDGKNDPDVLAINAASCALMLANKCFDTDKGPFLGPVAACRVGLSDSGEFILNPTFEEVDSSKIDVVVAGNKNGVMMIESGADEIDEKKMLEAIKFGYDSLKPLFALQEKLVAGISVSPDRPKRALNIEVLSDDFVSKIDGMVDKDIDGLIKIGQKEQRMEASDEIKKRLIEELAPGDDTEYTEKDIALAFYAAYKRKVRSLILKKGVRPPDPASRAFDALRPITCEAGVLPRTHGSGLFTRGQTQSLAITTLGTSIDEQMIEDLEGKVYRNFMLHYNFPSFSVGEIKPVRGPGRREIGHGALAARALKPIIPSKEDFPYTIRLVSEILESNGSSSMATVCAGTLSLMDAGVPIKKPVSGIAMGLIKEGDDFRILTDISGLEDHFGDMDFKVAGTADGITALQMDIKIGGVGLDIVESAMKDGRKARLEVLDKIMAVIAKPKETISEFAPRIVTIKIDTDKIKDVIGPGGKMIRKITEETGATIDIDDDGTVNIASVDNDKVEQAVQAIKNVTKKVEVGEIYMGTVKKIMNFGAFCEIVPGKEGLVHVSELGGGFVKNVGDVVKIGDKFLVKVIEIDAQGRVNLSKKQAQDPKE